MSDVTVYKGHGVAENSYPMEKVVEALTALVKHRGNLKKTTEETGVGYETLRKWAQVEHSDRYLEIESEYGRELEQVLVMEARETAHAAGTVERIGVAKLLDQMQNGFEQECRRCGGSGAIKVKREHTDCPRCEGAGTVHIELGGRELAQSVYALAKVKATNIDRVLALTGRPKDGGSRNTAEDGLSILRELHAMGAIKVDNQAAPVEGAAEDESG